MVMAGFGQAAKTKVAAATSNPRHRGRRPRAVPAMDGVIDVDAAATPGGMWGMKGCAPPPPLPPLH